MIVKKYKRIGPKLQHKWNIAKIHLVKYPKIEIYLNKFFSYNESEKINHSLVNLLYSNSEKLLGIEHGLSLLTETLANKQSINKIVNTNQKESSYKLRNFFKTHRSKFYNYVINVRESDPRIQSIPKANGFFHISAQSIEEHYGYTGLKKLIQYNIAFIKSKRNDAIR